MAAAALATETHATERASKLPHGPSSDASGVEERNVVGDVVAATGKTDSLISESEQGPDGVMGGKGEVTQRTPGESGSDAVMEAQREGEDDEAFMVSCAKGRAPLVGTAHGVKPLPAHGANR